MIGARSAEILCKRGLKQYYDNPEKGKAKHKVYIELTAGRLIKPFLCEHCQEAKKLNAHHEDYLKPLDVIWLCHRCHGRVHRRLV